jgi:hypothetical protein
MCDDSKSNLKVAIRSGISLLILQLFLQIAAYSFVTFNEKLKSKMEGLNYIELLVHNVPFMFYHLFCTISSVYVEFFNCFKKVMVQALRKKIMISTDDQWCVGTHDLIKQKQSLSADIDCLRRMHESIRESMMAFNNSLNPQILIHQFIELLVMVMHLYSVIMFFSTETRTPELYTIFCMDVLFIFVHSCALVVFLKSANNIKVTVRSSRLSRFSISFHCCSFSVLIVGLELIQ